MYLFDHISEANAKNNCMTGEQTLLCSKEAEQGRNYGAKYRIVFEISDFCGPKKIWRNGVDFEAREKCKSNIREFSGAWPFMLRLGPKRPFTGDEIIFSTFDLWNNVHSSLDSKLCTSLSTFCRPVWLIMNQKSMECEYWCWDSPVE